MIYLDNAATTAPVPETERAAAFCRENFGNPSALYGAGLAVAGELKRAREVILAPIADPAQYDLEFTSGGTEADNHAVFSAARRGNAVTTAGEHAAVYESFKELKNRGVEPRFAPLRADGSADARKLLDLVDEKTTLVSVVHVNNETGAVNDIASLARAVKEKNPRCLFFSDGVQAYGKLAFRLPREVDLYSVSAHKIGGWKGTGALIRRKDAKIPPLLFGGGQERGMRSGTENVFGILAFSHAAARKFGTINADSDRLAAYREAFWSLLDRGIFTRISPSDGSPYILTVSARGLRGEILQRLLEERGVIVGTGSACSSKKPYSRVIEACGYGKDILGGVLRVSFSPATCEKDIGTAAEAFNASARELKGRIG